MEDGRCVWDMAFEENFLVAFKIRIVLKISSNTLTWFRFGGRLCTTCLIQLVVVEFTCFSRLHIVEVTITFFEGLLLKLRNFFNSPWTSCWTLSGLHLFSSCIFKCLSLQCFFLFLFKLLLFSCQTEWVLTISKLTHAWILIIWVQRISLSCCFDTFKKRSCTSTFNILNNKTVRSHLLFPTFHMCEDT